MAFMRQAEQTVADTSKPSYQQHAYQLFASACMADPTYADAFYQYGNNNSDLKCPDAAIASWRRALECGAAGEARSRILSNLGWHYQMRGETQLAEAMLLEAKMLTPDEGRVWCNLSIVNRDLGRTGAMVHCARKAFALQPEDIHNEIALAFALLFDGQYQEGFARFEKRFEWRLHNFTKYPYEKWTGEPDKIVFLVADQGLGDTLSFSRFVPEVASRSKYVHLYVQPELVRLFQYAFVRHLNINILPMGQLFPQADAWTTFVSLPFALGLTDEQVREAPHIEAPSFSHPRTWLVPDRKFNIGIAWGGSPQNDIDQHRNVPLHHFLELYRVPGVQLYSFQVDQRAQEMHQQGCVGLIRDMKPYIRDVCDSLTFLKDIDLVVCCESAMGHIAALAGKETWIPYSYLGRDYRIGANGEKLLWTPQHRVFRQAQDRKWELVFEQIVEALKKRVKS